jgi:imidazolonepropionase-like amidohydrolase
LIEAMKRRGTLFEPTLTVFARDDRTTALSEWATAVTRRLAAAGVPMVAGTDNMIDDDPAAGPNIHRELELLVSAGLSPRQAITAATLHAARALGIESQVGSVRPGMRADLLLLGADPLAAIRNTRLIELVLQRGVEVRR